MTIVPYCEAEDRLACAQAGCDDCLKSLLRENRALIWAVVNAQWVGYSNYADLKQEARIGFWQAVKHFDPQRGIRFSGYAWLVMRRRIWNAVAAETRAEGWLEEPSRPDQMAELISKWQSAQIREALDEGLDQLPKRQRQLLVQHYGWDGCAPQNLSEIGQAWGLSRERIRQIRNDALMLLRIPALSIRLRSICERQSRGNYRGALHQNQVGLRKQRRRR
jgi:RNA polymerase sigma factor (sigma-70 family)